MNAAVLMETCPSEETLAAFLDGRLTGQARLEVVEHLADCGECRDIVMAADEYRRMPVADENSSTADLPKVAAGRFGSRVFAPLVAAAAIVAVLFGVPSIRERIFGPDGMEELVKAADALPKRPMAARLSGNFAYREHSAPRGPEATTEEAAVWVELAAANSEERARKAPTAENLHELGVANVLMKSRTEAVKVLKQAAEASPTSADILTDLAAAYIANGDYQRAYDAATKAWSIEPTPAAAWNIALSLEDDGKYAEAIAAWQQYLKLDPNSEWSTEAKRRLNDLKSR
jgi:cytochrome c-type biogenesis protein CcmH/NrfG